MEKHTFGGFWARFGALLVDLVLLFLVWHFLLSPVFMKIGMNMFSETTPPTEVTPPQKGSAELPPMETILSKMHESIEATPSRMIAWIWVVQITGLLVFGGYFVILEGGPGQTVGKKAMGLRVVSPDGSSIGYRKAFLRYMGKIIGGLTLCLGFVMAAYDGEKRALHDRMVDSRVVRL